MMIVKIMVIKMMVFGCDDEGDYGQRGNNDDYSESNADTRVLLFIAGCRPGRRVQPQVQLLLRRPSGGAPRLLRRPHLVRYSCATVGPRGVCSSDSLPSSDFHPVACGLAPIGFLACHCQGDYCTQHDYQVLTPGKRTRSLLTQQFLSVKHILLSNRTKRK